MDEMIEEENLVRVINALVKVLNLKQLGFLKPKSEWNEDDAVSGLEIYSSINTLLSTITLMKIPSRTYMRWGFLCGDFC